MLKQKNLWSRLNGTFENLFKIWAGILAWKFCQKIVVKSHLWREFTAWSHKSRGRDIVQIWPDSPKCPWLYKAICHDFLERFKAIGGGVNPKILYFLSSDICCSPSYLVFRMGSLSSQLPAVAEIWVAEVGPYAHFFTKMYGKSGKNLKNFR